MGWDGANGDRKRSERAARLLRESLVQLGYPLAVILATAVFALVSQLPEREFLTWGWRVPFLLSAILVGIGLYIRLRLVETPAFRQVQEGHALAKMPLLEILTKHPRTFLVSVGLKISERKSTRLNSSHRCISYAVFC